MAAAGRNHGTGSRRPCPLPSTERRLSIRVMQVAVPQYFLPRLRRALRFGKFLVQVRDTLETGSALISIRPLHIQHLTFLPHVRVGHVLMGHQTQTLEQGLVRESPLKARASILDQAVEDVERSDLFVAIAVFSAARSAVHHACVGEDGKTHSFFRSALAASVGPDCWMRMTSTRSMIPPKSSSAYCSLQSRSICTVTAEYGFFCHGCQYYWDRPTTRESGGAYFSKH